MNLPDDQQLEPLRRVLKQYWGFDSFLPLQAESMQCVLQRHDSVVVLPTGGGKSLCFQAPAMCLDGLAVVVSPLISLMKDQVDALRECGIPAACVNSMLSSDQRRQIAEEVRAGRLRLLYMAPERLLADRTLEFLRSANVSLFAIDEAHCISSWGHDFRPEYRGLRLLKQQFPEVGIHAFTATASENVREDIAAQLGLTEPQMLVGSFDRPNLIYKVGRRTNALAQIQAVMQRYPNQSGIIYCISRKEVDQVCADLAQLGYRVAPYHAGMPDLDRQRNQDAFINEQIDAIVATVAFGMGIDKSNVRYVIHCGMPKSLESYQQESGRAGRDGLEAECWLLYSGADYGTWKRMIESGEPEGRDSALSSLGAMYNFCCGVDCRHRAIVSYFGQQWEKSSCDACDVCLGELDTVDDPMIVGQKILSCVLRVDERFGADYVAQVLAGSRDQRIVQNGHDQLSTWGILSDQNKRAIRDWIEQLASQDFLRKSGEFNVVQVTMAGRQLLRGEGAPRLLRPTAKIKPPAAARADSWEGVDRDLFEQLRQLRTEKATAQQVPAYIIFSDASLRDMARRRPSTLQSFLQVRGVGEKKCTDYGEAFVQLIVRHCEATGLTLDQAPVPMRNTDDEATGGPPRSALAAFQHFDKGLSVDEVAELMQRAPSTVNGYLDAYIRHHGVCDPDRWVDARTKRLVTDAATQYGADRLKPIYEALQGEISYDDIRIVVTCLRNAVSADPPSVSDEKLVDA